MHDDGLATAHLHSRMLFPIRDSGGSTNKQGSIPFACHAVIELLPILMFVQKGKDKESSAGHDEVQRRYNEARWTCKQSIRRRLSVPIELLPVCAPIFCMLNAASGRSHLFGKERHVTRKSDGDPSNDAESSRGDHPLARQPCSHRTGLLPCDGTYGFSLTSSRAGKIEM